MVLTILINGAKSFVWSVCYGADLLCSYSYMVPTAACDHCAQAKIGNFFLSASKQIEHISERTKKPKPVKGEKKRRGSKSSQRALITNTEILLFFHYSQKDQAQAKWSMKICQTCLSYIPKQHYQYESSLLEFACALCRISFDFHLRKIKTDSCKHAAILKDDCKSCHTFKCASMGMSTQRILLGKYVYNYQSAPRS